MPGKVKVKIIAGRNLPVMDRSADTTDAYVEIKLGNTTYKTDVCRKSLNPQWSSEWYRFEVDDSELQDEPLQIRLMDYDVYSANDAIGKVYLDLNPLLLSSGTLACNLSALRLDSSDGLNTSSTCLASGGSSFAGWVPVFDTMHGIRGEVNLIVKVELFSDTNKFRQSSCGVQFFCSPSIPYGFQAQVIHGFVEELVVNDDPEYQWIDKIRTPRASNEARQTLFFKLSGEVQRRIGLKVLDIGGNAVIGYHKCFDLEGESGIVVRGIGTAVTLVRQRECPPASISDELPFPAAAPGSGTNNCVEEHRSGGSGAACSTPSTHSLLANKLSPARLITGPMGMHRRSSDSDLSVTPKGSILGGSGGSAHNRHSIAPALGVPRAHLNQESSLDMMEYPFLTMAKYPPGFILRLGGMVSSRSVKLLERTTSTEDHESRDTWWNELRMEVRSHARALACNVVLGYKEQSSICEDVCVLSASGTAALISLQHNVGMKELNLSKDSTTRDVMHSSLDQADMLILEEKVHPKSRIAMDSKEDAAPQCTICHVPYSTTNAPMPVSLLKCAVCRQGKVPDVLFTTIEPPEGIPITGRGCLLQAHVFRPKKDCRGELNAREISDGLPFLEYELHRTLINKLRVKGMNSLFNLKVQVSIGERWLVGVATGTAIFLSPMAAPPVPRVAAGDSWSNKAEVAEMQKKLHETSKRNREHFCVQPLTSSTPLLEKQCSESKGISDSEESDEDLPDLEPSCGNKDAFILEVDDTEDINVVALLIEPRIPDGFDVVNTEFVPGQSNLEIVCNLQMFTQVWRARMNACQGATSLSKHFHRLQQSLYFKLRKMVPCALCHMNFNVELPEADEIQISVVGMALGLADPQVHAKSSGRPKREALKKSDDTDLIFKLDEDCMQPNSQASQPTFYLGQSNMLRGKHTAPRERYGVDITPLSYVPGARIEQYLGNLNFFFIRESTTIRECGGLSGFVHSFVAEVLAIVRAHVTALGGNAMVAYFMNECVLLSSSHKNQGQCLINVGGDVVHVAYTEE